jgi:hypothetical protein
MELTPRALSRCELLTAEINGHDAVRGHLRNLILTLSSHPRILDILLRAALLLRSLIRSNDRNFIKIARLNVCVSRKASGFPRVVYTFEFDRARARLRDIV